MNVHKNARLTPQGRFLVVRRIDEQGWRVADPASAAGLSVRRTYHWPGRYRSPVPTERVAVRPRGADGQYGAFLGATRSRPST